MCKLKDLDIVFHISLATSTLIKHILVLKRATFASRMSGTHTIPEFSSLNTVDIWKYCWPSFSLKTPGSHLSLDGQKLLETMSPAP